MYSRSELRDEVGDLWIQLAYDYRRIFKIGMLIEILKILV